MPASSSHRLPDERIASLLDEVVAMVRSGRSIRSGLDSLDHPSMGQLGKAAANIRNRISRGEPIDEAMTSLSPQYDSAIAVAMQQLVRNGATDPVYEVAQAIRKSESQRRERLTQAINPAVNLFFAVTITCWVLPRLATMSPNPLEIKTLNENTWLAWGLGILEPLWVGPLLAAIVTGVFWFVFWCSAGGNRHGIGREATLCRWLAMLIPSGADTATVIDAASEAAYGDAPGGMQAWRGVGERIRTGATGKAALDIPGSVSDPTRQCILAMTDGTQSPESIADDLRRWGQCLQRRADQKQRGWTVMMPRLLSTLMILVLLVTIIVTSLRPLLHEIIEVSS